MMDLV